MRHELPPLPYELDALEPFISAQTLDFHHNKHHQAYVDNLNRLIVGTPFENATLEEIIKQADGAIFNNGSQVWNHTFYFAGPRRKPKFRPGNDLGRSIDRDFGSFENFLEQFNAASTGLFGSGWTWLSVNEAGKLEISQESNAGNPLRKNWKPLLTLDVWEHAYYLDTQNLRAKYIENFWKVLDWEVIENRYLSL